MSENVPKSAGGPLLVVLRTISVEVRRRAVSILASLVVVASGLIFATSAQAQVGLWTLDEGTGQTAGDSAGTNDGTLGTTPLVDPNDPTWTCGGTALDFDGTNYLVEIPDDPT